MTTPTSGEEVVAALLRALPPPLAERILARLSPTAADRLRARFASPQATAQVPLDKALREFTDVQRIVDRTKANADDTADPIQALRALEADRLLAALRDEQPPAVARVMACLEPPAAAELIKRLSAEVRPEVALRLSQGGAGNREVLACLARAVVARCQAQKDAPPNRPPTTASTARPPCSAPCPAPSDWKSSSGSRRPTPRRRPRSASSFTSLRTSSGSRTGRCKRSFPNST